MASDKFFYGIIALAVLQGLWYALTIQPGMYDEGTHLGYIFMYTHHLGPFITHQSPQWDYLGETTRNGSYLFYYLMSWPARFVEVFTNNQTAVIVALRLIMVTTFALGLYVYRRVFLAVQNIPRGILHAGLLLVILTPMLAPEGGVVNYDNAVFLLTALLLLVAIRVIRSESVRVVDLGFLLVIGLAGSEVKFEFLAVFAPVAVFVSNVLLCRHGLSLWRKVNEGLTAVSKYTAVGLCVAVLISIGLFIERPVYNFVNFHSINGAPCQEVESLSRCLQNPIIKRNFETEQSKPVGFNPLNPFTYTSALWVPTMVGTLIIVLAGVPVFVVPALFYYSVIYLGSILILLYVRHFLKQPANRLLLFSLVVYVLGLLAFNYRDYVSLGAAFAMNGRYLLPVLPIFMIFMLLAFKRLLGARLPNLSLAGFVVVLLLLFTQGGSIGTAILTIPPSGYWGNAQVVKINDGLQRVMHHVVLERNPFDERFH